VLQQPAAKRGAKGKVEEQRKANQKQQPQTATAASKFTFPLNPTLMLLKDEMMLQYLTTTPWLLCSSLVTVDDDAAINCCIRAL